MKKRGKRRFNLLRFFLLLAMTDLIHFSDAHPVYLFATPGQRCPPRPSYNSVKKKAGSNLSLDIDDISHFRTVTPPIENERHADLTHWNWDDDRAEVDAVMISSAGVDQAISFHIKDGPSSKDELMELPFEKRGGKGMSRHLFAAAVAATLAMGTASMGIFANSLKAYDQDKYGVSRKTGLQDKSKSKDKDKDGEKGKGNGGDSKGNGKGKGEKKGKDGDGQSSPSSPTFINHVTYVNNFDINPGQASRHRRNVEGCQDDDSNLPFVKRTITPAAAPPVKGWHKYDKHAPFLEKVEDYGKMAAATGAFAAAIVASYSAVKAHNAYHQKELKSKEDSDGDDVRDKDKDKGGKKDEDDDKHKRRDLWAQIGNDDADYEGLVPSILPCNSILEL